MDFARRSLIAVAFMSLGLVALVVDGVDEGWTTLGAVGVACLAVAIAAQLVALRQHRAT
jgi:membrane-bound ClpP family serine protease